MWIEWRVRWRGDERVLRWEDGALGGDAAVAEAFGRYVLSNAPATAVPPEERLRDPALVRQMVAEFADAIIETRDGA